MKTWGIVGVAVFAAACGGSNVQAKKATTGPQERSDDGVLRPITQGQMRVAHYATGDGTLGLVLDRTSGTPKVQMDGQKEIVELTMLEDRRGHRLEGHRLVDPEGHEVLYLSADGGLAVRQGFDTRWLNSDRSAERLGSPTRSGRYVEPKSAWDRQVEALTPLAVRTRFPRFQPEDSSNLAKVAEALAAATPDMVVRLTKRAAEEASWAPASSRVGTTDHAGGLFSPAPLSESTRDAKAKEALARFGGRIEDGGIRYGEPSQARLYAFKDWQRQPAQGTPGLIWELDGGTVVFVTLDGGRYQFSVANDESPMVERGAGSQRSWPAPLQHALLDSDVVDMLGKGGAVTADVVAQTERARRGWYECVEKLWKSTETQLDQIEASAIPMNDKWGRLAGVRKSAELAAPKQCGGELAKLEAHLVSFIETRNRERMALFEKAKTRFR